MTDQPLETAEEIEGRCASLRQYASVMGDFYEALTASRVPPELAQDAVLAWWENVLQPAEREFEDD